MLYNNIKKKQRAQKCTRCFLFYRLTDYKSVIGEYFGTNIFINSQAAR